MWKNVYNRLQSGLTKARKQFESFDKSHDLLRVVVFTSNHPQLNFNSCKNNILGIVQLGEELIQDYREKPEFKYTEKDRRSIDIILWAQINRYTKEIFETEYFVNMESKHINKMDDILKTLNLHKRYVFYY